MWWRRSITLRFSAAQPCASEFKATRPRQRPRALPFDLQREFAALATHIGGTLQGPTVGRVQRACCGVIRLEVIQRHDCETGRATNMWKRRATEIAAALALLTQQGPASAQLQDTGSADYVIVGCRDGMSGENRQPFRQGLCGGIVQTILYFGRTSFNVCIPEGVTMGQAIRVVVAYIDQRPERLHDRFETLALEVLQQSWPCQKVGGGRA